MPTFMTERVARSVYRAPQPQVSNQPPVPPVTYSRRFFAESDTFTKRAKALVEHGVESPVLIVGCGIGLLNEALEAEGILSYGIEPGPWCWKQMARTPPNLTFNDPTSPSPEHLHPAEHRIIDDWVGSGQTAHLLGQRGMPTHYAHVIDEDAAPAHADEELNLFFSSLEELGDHVIHLVTPMNISTGPGDSSQNWKTIEQWRQAPANPRQHTWIDLSR